MFAHFLLIFPFYNPWKTNITCGFLVFPGGNEMGILAINGLIIPIFLKQIGILTLLYPLFTKKVTKTQTCSWKGMGHWRVKELWTVKLRWVCIPPSSIPFNIGLTSCLPKRLQFVSVVVTGIYSTPSLFFQAFMQGKIKVIGNMGLAMKLQQLKITDLKAKI